MSDIARASKWRRAREWNAQRQQMALAAAELAVQQAVFVAKLAGEANVYDRPVVH